MENNGANELFSGGTTNNLTGAKEDYSPYCPVCDGCGEEGCCKPTNCSMSPDGYYCQTYLRDLKIVYICYMELTQKMFEEGDKYKELREFDEKNYDEAFDRFGG